MFQGFGLSKQSDSEIVTLTKQNPEVFRELYNRYAKKVYRFVRYRISTDHDAEDITADIFMKALNKLAQYNPEYAFSTWLFTIARNTIIDFWRTQKETLDLEYIDELVSQAASQEDVFDVHKRVEYIMSRLSEKDRILVVLRCEQDLEYADIARITGRSEQSLRTAFHRLQKSLSDDNTEV